VMSSEHKGPRIPRVVEDPQHLAMAERTPNHISFLRSTSNASGGTTAPDGEKP
jgi:hypothetical protein